MTTVTGTEGRGAAAPAPGGGQTGTVMGPAATAEVVQVADPAPLGLAGFGLTTMVLSVINAGWIDAAATPVVLSLALPYGGIAQALAGMWAFRRGNTFAATAFTSYGAFWLSYFLLVNGLAKAVSNPVALSAILGTYLFMWGIFTLYMFIASLGGVRAVQGVFLFLTATFMFLAFGAWSNDPTSVLTKIGGYLGIITAILALYTSFADVTNATLKRTVLPTDF
ncbi:MAG: acetate uptake transporter [Candidatus Dormibacteria bacterium]